MRGGALAARIIGSRIEGQIGTLTPEIHRHTPLAIPPHATTLGTESTVTRHTLSAAWLCLHTQHPSHLYFTCAPA